MPIHPMRRSEKAITDPAQWRAIIAGQQYMTLALCREGEPYLVSLSYGYDPEANCFYFHCAAEGRKMDYWRANPIVWGQIIEDHGYVTGECIHAFRTVQFRGTVSLIEDVVEKRRALHLMIDALDPDPEPVKRRQVTDKAVANVTIGKVQVTLMTGKQSG